ncbi:hypothetical protein ATI61_102231 [Archangium gephyra]|uniref:Uncharacterized protein n=1 Tax=Archangium gephyra TaxID=48 RepID=A0AAC8QCL7_9BACT|nr:hypothetical protein [Archangium gephyra]AKJ05163.1 Hypothetical protein AA314_06789 [Archangium gephyra]REG35858.1 hypothetical protein ATI61_102231 [Archangium gephyra]
MWIETIVMPREEPAAHYRPAPQRDRAAAQASACALGEQFRDTVLSYLQSHALMDSVRWVSAPGSIPLVTLHCTSTVLEQLQREPRFEAGRSLTFPAY